MKKVLKLLLAEKKIQQEAYKDCVRLSKSAQKQFQNVFKRGSIEHRKMVEELDKAIKILNGVPCGVPEDYRMPTGFHCAVCSCKELGRDE